jgi:hypothetical protein
MDGPQAKQIMRAAPVWVWDGPLVARGCGRCQAQGRVVNSAPRERRHGAGAEG